jgi:hypothetical protein
MRRGAQIRAQLGSAETGSRGVTNQKNGLLCAKAATRGRQQRVKCTNTLFSGPDQAQPVEREWACSRYPHMNCDGFSIAAVKQVLWGVNGPAPGIPRTS